MYIGKYGVESFFTNNYTSFATGYVDAGNGKVQYCGSIADGSTGCGNISSNRTAARKSFCQLHGPVKCSNGVNLCYGEKCPQGVKNGQLIGTIKNTGRQGGTGEAKQVDWGDILGTKSSSSGGGGGGSSNGGGGGGTSASDKCGGCNSGDIGCEIGKWSCEGTNFLRGWWDGMGDSISKGTGGIGLVPIIVVGGLLALIVIAKR